MSLLNDALRAAEQRQQRPNAPGAYTGQAVQGGQGGRRWLTVFVLLLVSAVALLGFFWFVDAPSPAPEVPQVVSPAETQPKAVQQQTQQQMPEPELQVEVPVSVDKNSIAQNPRVIVGANARTVIKVSGKH